jgi:hypothetical protein
MGSTQSTYCFFGLHVPEDQYQTDHQQRETEYIDAMIRHTPKLQGRGLGHVTAGDYDRDMLFLAVTDKDWRIEVPLGEFHVFDRRSYRPEWAHALAELVNALGYNPPGPPGWVVVPDCS